MGLNVLVDVLGIRIGPQFSDFSIVVEAHENSHLVVPWGVLAR